MVYIFSKIIFVPKFLDFSTMIYNSFSHYNNLNIFDRSRNFILKNNVWRAKQKKIIKNYYKYKGKDIHLTSSTNLSSKYLCLRPGIVCNNGVKSKNSSRFSWLEKSLRLRSFNFVRCLSEERSPCQFPKGFRFQIGSGGYSAVNSKLNSTIYCWFAWSLLAQTTTKVVKIFHCNSFM